MKKILALALALIMVLGLATTVSAKDADLTNHTYRVYQIFTGTQTTVEGDAKLAVTGWGTDVDGAAILAALQANSAFGAAEANVFKDCETARDVAEVLAANSANDDTPFARAFAKVVNQNLAKNAGQDLTDQLELDPGYYLVVDTTVFPEGEEDTVWNLSLLQLTKKGALEINTKVDVPEVEKKVIDVNDSVANNAEEVRQDSADYDIGDDVPFILTATLASDVSSYDVYKVVFHDTLAAGLDYNEDAVVKFGNKVLYNKNGDANVALGGITVAEENGALTITIPDVKHADIGAGNSAEITVEYTAKLTEDANIGAEGNKNLVKLEYSNDPNWVAKPDGETPPPPPTGFTPEDQVIVFTYEVVANKVDEAGEDLNGATFALYKYDADADVEKEEDKWILVGDGPITGTASHEFTWVGVDDGTYKLVEVEAPAGYNKIDDIVFEITAEHTEDAAEPELTKLDGGTFTGDITSGKLTADIENKPGVVLPETGGMGTTLFYVIGGLLVAAAVVLLVTKKRMASAE